MNDIPCVVLTPGRSDSLWPLTRDHCSLSLPFAGRHLLADIPLSNGIHSGFRRFHLLTSRPGNSLREHLRQAYPLDPFTPGGVDILPVPDQAGSAQKLREAWPQITGHNPDRVILLFGGELFRMDLRELLRTHLEQHNDITLSLRPVTATQAQTQTLAKISSRGLVQQLGFPPYSQGLEEWMAPPDCLVRFPDNLRAGFYAPLGAMVMETPVLENLLSLPKPDLLKDLLGDTLWEHRTGLYLFGGHWDDLTTIRGYHRTSLNLTTVHPSYNLYDGAMPLLCPPSYLPPAKVNFGTLSQVLASDGVIVNNAEVNNSLLGMRSVLETGVQLEGVVLMGADRFEDSHTQALNRARGIPHLGIGRGTALKNALVGKNARIGEGCRIGTDPIHRADQDCGHYVIKEGIIVLPDEAVIPHGTVI